MKKINYKLIASGLYLTFIMSGCSIMPYENNFACNKGIEGGACDTVSNNYKATESKSFEKSSMSTEVESKKSEELMDRVNICFTDYYQMKDKPDVAALHRCVVDNKPLVNSCSGLLKKQEVVGEMLYYQQLENEKLRQKIGELK